MKAVDVSQAPNDKQQLAPLLDRIAGLPDDVGRPDTLLADTGYFSVANVEACAKASINPVIAPGRDGYHPGVDGRFVPAPPAPEDPTPLDTMLHRLTTPEGRALYARRKHTPEPVFSIINSVLSRIPLSVTRMVGSGLLDPGGFDGRSVSFGGDSGATR